MRAGPVPSAHRAPRVPEGGGRGVGVRRSRLPWPLVGRRGGGIVTLDDLVGAVQYKTWDGSTADALIHTRVLYSRPEDQSYPHPYRQGLNRRGVSISFTQAAIDRGDVWLHPEPSRDVDRSILTDYNTARRERFDD